MTALARIVVVLVPLAFAHASENSTAQKSLLSGSASAAPSQHYKICQNNKVDLTSVLYLDFKSPQIKCENSTYCSVLAAQVISTTCRNSFLGSSPPAWNCGSTFSGTGFAVYTSTVYCSDPEFPCVYKNSCEFRYTPRVVSQPVAVYGGVGGTLSFIVFCGIIYWCCCRRKRQNPAPAPIIIRTQAPPPAREPTPDPTPAKVSASQTNFTVNFAPPPTMYPAPTFVAAPHPSAAYPGHAPGYPGPAPAYPAPAYAPPSSPPYNPNY